MSTAIVTGGARGIGAAIARRLVAEGHSVGILDLRRKEAESLAAELAALAPGRAVAVECDVGIRESVEKAVAAVTAALDEPAVLVNGAGFGGPFHRIDEVSEEEWDRLVATNLKSVFLFSRLLLPRMKARGYGRIVNIASIQGLLGAARSTTYVATKHGMIGYTKAIAAEWGPYGITCNAICPGYVDTAMGVQDDKVDSHLHKILARTPVKRVGTSAEIAALTLHLIGPESGYINGASLVVDGGISAHVGIE